MIKTKIGDITYHTIPVPMFSRVLTNKEVEEIRNAKYPSSGQEGEPISNDTFIEWTKDIFKSKIKGPRLMYVYSEETKQYFINNGFPAEMIVVLKPLSEDEADSNS
ncbi:MAG: hypothetical protein GYA51_07530 [Candidatus Methanofastidiosa archaeon]|nr:hypothetical protein [Candidatus Methanofastidiosa archaeon]